MFSKSKIAELKEMIVKQIQTQYSDLFNECPINEYVKYLDCHPRYSGYNYFDQRVFELSAKLRQNISKHTYSLYFKALFLTLIERSVEILEKEKYPQPIVQLFLAHFDKIISRVETNSLQDEWFDFTQDKFCKDLSICIMRLIPVGPQLLIEKRIPIKFLYRGGMGQLSRKMRCLVFWTKGVAPVYGMHMNQLDPVLMASFNPDGWKRMFEDVAELLKMKQKIKAIVGTSWFFDPVISKVSPEMGYFRNLVEEIGGFVFRQTSSAEVVRNATFMNPNRKRLYDRGEYNPVNYISIIPREAIINWAQNKSEHLNR